MATTLVLGASGRTGSVVAQSLLERGQKVRVLVHEAAKGERWKKRGAEVAVGSVEDAHAMGAALRGAEAAYLLMPPSAFSATGVLARARRIVDVFMQTVAGSHLKHAVLLSSVGANLPTGTGLIQSLHVAEKALGTLKVPCTFLRACYFVENWGSRLEAAKSGQLPGFIPVDFRFPQVGTHDIGVVAAELLSVHPKAHRVVELAGPEEVSGNDVAAALGKLLGQTVQAVAYPVAEMASVLPAQGFSAEMAALFQEMTEGIVSRRIAFEHPESVRRGKQPLEVTLGEMLKKG